MCRQRRRVSGDMCQRLDLVGFGIDDVDSSSVGSRPYPGLSLGEAENDVVVQGGVVASVCLEFFSILGIYLDSVIVEGQPYLSFAVYEGCGNFSLRSEKFAGYLACVLVQKNDSAVRTAHQASFLG